MIKITRYSLFIILIIFMSCKHEIENPSWTVDLIAPIATTELKLTNLLKESNVDIDTNDNNELLLVYQLNTIDTNLNDIIADSNLSFTDAKELSIPSINIDNIGPINHIISLGNIIKNTPLDGIIIHNTPYNGNLGPTMITGKSTNLPAINNFNLLELESGEIEIKLINNTPANIGDGGLGLTLSIKNQNPTFGSIVNIDNNGNPILLGAGDTIIISKNLNNVVFTNLLRIECQDFDFKPINSSTPIDTTTGLEFEIKIKNLVLNKIEGIIEDTIPLENKKTQTYLDIDGLNAKRAKIDSGGISLQLETILDMPIKIEFYSPNIYPNEPILIELNSNTTQNNIDLSGKEVLFNGQNGDTINTFYYEIYGFIPPTMVSYSAAINNSVNYSISAFLKPDYLVADIEDITMDIAKDSFEIDFFNDLEIGNNFSIESAKITLGIENKIGVGCSYDLNIESQNFTTGNQSILPNIQNTINSAIFNPVNNIVTPSYSEHPFNNLESIINIKPDLITMEGTITLENGIDRFLVYDQGIAVSPNIEIPLSFIATDLILSDTTDIEIPSEVEDIKFNLIIENGYPINAVINIDFLDQSYNILESKELSMLSGEINSEGRVYQNSKSIFNIDLNKENIEYIKYVHYYVSFDTQSQTTYNKIYSDYTIKAQIIAEYNSVIGE